MKREGQFSILNSQFSIRRRHRRRSGFTLIEMLVVIVIIVILMGVVFRLSRGAMAKSDYAAEEKRVSILRTLIEEFHAEYNLYPPVPEYTFKDVAVNFSQMPDFSDDYKKKFPNSRRSVRFQPVNFFGAYPKRGDHGDLLFYRKNYSRGSDHFFAFGLLSHFLDRAHFCNQAFSVAGDNDRDGVQDDWQSCNDPTKNKKAEIPAKDKAFVKRVAPIVAQICEYETGTYEREKRYVFLTHVYVDSDNGHSKGFTSEVYDSWGHEYVYVSKPPYTSYLIFSAGPDGKYDPEYPGDRSREGNKDNIYGNLGDN